MTLISVGSAGSTGGTKAGHGSPADDSAPASGFGELLAGAHAPHDARADAARAARHERDTEPCDQTEPRAYDADAADDADASDAAEANATDPGDDAPAKPDGADDATGVVAALALTTPITPTTTVAATDGTAAGGDGTTVVGDTTPVEDPAAGDAAAPPLTSQVVDLADVLAGLPIDDAPPAGDPVLLPMPDLPTASASAAKAHADSPAASTTNAARESFAAPGPSTERPHAPTAPPATGAATFAPAPPPPPATAAMASVTAEDGTAARVTPPPSEQLVSVLTPLRTNQNGSYTLRLELKPPELGRVEMRVEMRDGVLHASIHAEHHNSAQTLRDALSDLRDRLGAEGVRTGDLSVSDGGVGARQDASSSAPESRAAGDNFRGPDDVELTADAPTSSPTSSPDTTSLLDVRV